MSRDVSTCSIWPLHIRKIAQHCQSVMLPVAMDITSCAEKLFRLIIILLRMSAFVIERFYIRLQQQRSTATTKLMCRRMRKMRGKNRYLLNKHCNTNNFFRKIIFKSLSILTRIINIIFY